MTSPQAKARRRGADFEIKVVAWLRDHSLRAERLRLSGKQDEGDIAVEDVDMLYLIEAKDREKIDLSGFWREAQNETFNYAAKRTIPTNQVMPLVVIKRRGQPIGSSYVVTTLDEFFREVP